MRLVSRNLARLVAAATLAAAASVVVASAPASAATCSSADGVSVVVDFHGLGGGVRTACLADGGGQKASSLFPAAGFSLSYVQRQPGFVCRVSGVPADDPCVNTPPTDAYWGLWWSDGKSGSWSYASTGAGGLTVPEGGYVAFSWNDSASRSTPGVSPSPHPTAPTPTATPTKAPSAHPTHSTGPGQPTTSSGGSGGETSPDPTAPAPTDPSAAATRGPGRSKTPKPTTSISASPSESPDTPSATSESTDDLAPAASDPADPDDGGLPGWVAPVVIVLLFAGAGGAAVLRRRRGTPGP